jgi:ABC-type glycerol-3-phosphate transport system permease component
MAREVYAQFWSRRSIVSLIGIDYPILEKSNKDNYSKFVFTGVLVIVILLSSFISVFYAFELMFEMWHAEILLSLIFSLMFMNIYIFLIQTFSKEVFPGSSKYKFFNLSNLSRLGFVLLIGFLIAQPLKLMTIKEKLNSDIHVYKNSLFEGFCRKNAELHASDVDKLNIEKSYYLKLVKDEEVIYKIRDIDKKIQIIELAINSANETARLKIDESNFFVKRIELANKYPVTHIISLLIILIFFLPVALIFSISNDSAYYKEKKNKDRTMVEDDYRKFKKLYSQFFRLKYGVDNVEFYEIYIDPPFNTERKSEKEYLTQDDFLRTLS